jgi:hypothetical protein
LSIKKIKRGAGHRWLMPVILTTQEAEIRRIAILSHPQQIDLEKIHHKKKGWWME